MKPLYDRVAFMDEPVPEYSGGIFYKGRKALVPGGCPAGNTEKIRLPPDWVKTSLGMKASRPSLPSEAEAFFHKGAWLFHKAVIPTPHSHFKNGIPHRSRPMPLSVEAWELE